MDNIQLTKVCTTCGVEKPANTDFFYTKKDNGIKRLVAQCKSCILLKVEKYRLENIDKVRESQRKTTQSESYKNRRKEYLKVYNVEKREFIKEAQKRHYEENKVILLEKCKHYRNSNKEKKREQRKAYYKKNKEQIIEKVRKYSKDNTEKVKEAKRVRFQKNKKEVIEKQLEERRNNPQKKIRHTVSSRLLLALKSQNAKKNTKTTELLGCTVQFLKEYLESMFEEGMTWDNLTHGGWHIDHKIPCASFDLTDIEQQKACFHYTNLQPLWAEDNLKKGCKII